MKKVMVLPIERYQRLCAKAGENHANREILTTFEAPKNEILLKMATEFPQTTNTRQPTVATCSTESQTLPVTPKMKKPSDTKNNQIVYNKKKACLGPASKTNNTPQWISI